MHRNRDGGRSIIPIDHTTKRPRADQLPLILDLSTGEKKPSWKPYQDRLPTHEEIDQWVKAGIKAYAIPCGEVSGDLEVLDFDVPGFYELWMTEVGELVEGYKLPKQRTHSDNHQVAYRSPNRKGNQKLAWAKNDAEQSGREIAIETRGPGGYTVWAPSLGPSGKHYEAIAGDIANTPVIPEAVADVLLQAARRLCEMPYTRQELVSLSRQKEQGQRKKASADTADDVIAEHNRTLKVRDELRRIGQTDGPRGRMSRAGQPGSAGTVVLDAENICFPWSSNDPLHRANGDGKPLPIDPFDIFVHYDHNGNYQAAYIAAKKAQGKWREPAPKILIDPETGEILTVTNETPSFHLGDTTTAAAATTNGKADSTWLPQPGEVVIWHAHAGDFPAFIKSYAGMADDGKNYYHLDCPLCPGNGAVPLDKLSPPLGSAPIPEVRIPTPAIEDPEQEQKNPLDIQRVSTLALGWIDECADLMTALTGAPKEFNRIVALVTAATAIQGRARLAMSFGDIRPNLYTVIIARSSVFHKSSAINKSKTLLQRAHLENLLLATQMTSEGLLKQLQTRPAGVIVNDEIGRLFASHNQKYQIMLKPDLTELYDGGRVQRRLSNEEITVEQPYLNILGATTPARFYDSISLADWEDGFLARWLFVLPESEPDFDAMTGLFQVEHDIKLTTLAIKLSEIARQSDTNFVFAEGAFDLWSKWQRQAAKDAYLYGDDVIAAIVTRYAAYALKFALILSAFNGTWGKITPDDMQTAIHLADSYKAVAHKVLSERQSFGISGGKLQKVFAAIRFCVSKGDKATTKVLMQKTHMRKNEIEPCLLKLDEIGAVIAEKSGNGFYYVPVVSELPAKMWK